MLRETCEKCNDTGFRRDPDLGSVHCDCNPFADMLRATVKDYLTVTGMTSGDYKPTGTVRMDQLPPHSKHCNMAGCNGHCGICQPPAPAPDGSGEPAIVRLLRMNVNAGILCDHYGDPLSLPEGDSSRNYGSVREVLAHIDALRERAEQLTDEQCDAIAKSFFHSTGSCLVLLSQHKTNMRDGIRAAAAGKLYEWAEDSRTGRRLQHADAERSDVVKQLSKQVDDLTTQLAQARATVERIKALGPVTFTLPNGAMTVVGYKDVLAALDGAK